jgi:hypothetical protein
MALAMTVTQFVAQTYLLATGKTTALTAGSSKYTKILALGNLFTQQWAQEPGVDWASLRTIFSLGTVSATDTVALDSDIGKVSSQEGDFVRIAHTDGVSESEYTIVPISKLYGDGPKVSASGVSRRNAVGTCAISGTDLIFSRAFLATDAQFGGTISLPGYATPATLINANDTIAVDNPQWLCYAAAAEYDRNDITRVQLYPSLRDRAKELMAQMKDVNGSQLEEVYTGGWSPLGESW